MRIPLREAAAQTGSTERRGTRYKELRRRVLIAEEASGEGTQAEAPLTVTTTGLVRVACPRQQSMSGRKKPTQGGSWLIYF